jgi:dolichol kinase
MALTKEEVNRKLLHVIFGCVIPAGILYIPKIPGVSPYLPAVFLGIFLVLFILVEVIRFKATGIQKLFVSLVGSMLRTEENKKFTGATYICASSFICAVFFYRHPHISFMVLNLFILGDAAAAVVGLSMGRIKIGKKSLEGSLACFILCLILLFGVYPHVPLLLDAWGGRVPLQLVFIASLCITLFELMPWRITGNFVINDNLTVPVFTGIIMLLVYPLL